MKPIARHHKLATPEFTFCEVLEDLVDMHKPVTDKLEFVDELSEFVFDYSIVKVTVDAYEMNDYFKEII